MAAKKRPVKRVTVVDENYTPLEQYCIALNEYYKALRKAGFPESICMSMIMDKDSYPDWILPPRPIEKIGSIDPEEFEEDD
jgi:hypothetical protein